MKKLTPDTCMVRPFNEKEILTMLNRYMKPETLGPGQYFKPDINAVLIDAEMNTIVDDECIYSIVENMAHSESGSKAEIRPMYELPVRIITRTDNGDGSFSSTYPSYPTFYYLIPMSMLILAYTLPPVPLKQFMGSRFDYNPRIKTNTTNFLKLVNYGK